MAITSYLLFSYTAAVVSLPSMEDIGEGDGEVEVCASLMTTPAGSSLQEDITISLSTFDDIGQWLFQP